jgi:uncharacterized protein (DUF849 family)
MKKKLSYHFVHALAMTGSGRGHVRAGMEDGPYMYPHKDDLIKSSAETVTKVRRIAEELGREIATPKEARAILGLKGK